MNSTPSATRPGLNAFILAGRVYAFMGRFLLLAIAVSVVTMPLTQHVWTWDRFLHGGHDFEFGMLSILTTLSLVLLLAQHCKQSIGLLLAVFCRLFSKVAERIHARLGRPASLHRIEPLAAPQLGTAIFPLQI